MEVAQYSVKPSVSSFLLPQFFKLIGLCAAFYGGIWINFYLLGSQLPLWITILVIIALAGLLTAQLFITKKRANKWHYDFFSNRVEFYGNKLKSILYSNVQYVKVKRSLFERLTGTGTIALSKGFKISHVRNYEEIKNYLNQLIQNFRAYRAQQASARYAAGYGG